VSPPNPTLLTYGLVVSLLLALLAVGCAPGNPNVAATVNGHQISVDELNKGVDEALRDPQVPEQLKNDPQAKKSLQIEVLDALVQITLMEQAAKELGVTVTDQEVRARLQELITGVGGRQAYDQLLKERGLTEESVDAKVRSAVLGEKAKQKIDERVQVSDTDVAKAYADSTSARHILLRTKEEAQQVKDRIAAGEDFAAVAKERSGDEGTKDKGGDLGFVSRGSMVAEFEQALFAATRGEVVGPVQTQFGFHVIQRLPEPPLGEVQGQIKEELLQQRRGEAFSNFFAEQRAKAKVQVNPQFGVWDPSSGVRESAPLGDLKSEQPRSQGQPPAGQ
jgi:parvulin-like peptidyl-prolyl isomerase